jgi:FMN-dependent oxidoreductase (nitrilotriacetate monooxygenase family)
LTRQMHLGAFLFNLGNHVAGWRMPGVPTEGLMSFAFYRELAEIAERGKFDLLFHSDGVGINDSYDAVLRHSITIRPEPLTLLAALAVSTSRIGLAATVSTTYNEPYHIARKLAMLDFLSEGRAALNLVTSSTDLEARNFGQTSHLGHAERYERAGEFVDVLRLLWDSWEDGAVILDRDSGVVADPARIHRADWQGRYFSVRGPLNMPRPPQGHPVIIQAGQSARGSAFCARWGEVVFVSTYTSIEYGRQLYAGLKADIATAGRDPDSVAICPSTYVVAAATKAEAEDKMALIETLATDMDALSLLSEAMNFDFSTKGLDEAFTDAELAAVSGTQSMRDRVVRASGKTNPTVRDFIHFTRRARPNQAIVGGPKEVADGLERLFTEPVCDGFVLAATHIPGTYLDFTQHVVPELQRRGLYHKDYAGKTLRENLGLERPRRGYWHARAAAVAQPV